MRILFIGDIVGKPGRRIIRQTLAEVRQREELNFVIANAENAANGSGITSEIFQELLDSQVDCLTAGDHIYRRKEIIPTLETRSEIVKPANFPATSPGRCWTVLPANNGVLVGVISLLGRVYMRPVDCPFAAADRVLGEMPKEVKVRVVDFHAEATSDKQLMGRYLDGRVSAVLGTHTHVPTADEQILPGGTAFQCDVGMTGPYASIIGRRIDRVLTTTLTFRPTEFDVASEDLRICGAVVEVSAETGLSTAIRRLQVKLAPDGRFDVV